VCGGRYFSDTKRLFDVLDRVRKDRGLSVVVCGAQRLWSQELRRWVGADWLAIEWALSRQLPFIGHPAEWAVYGRSAGPRRNERMPIWWEPELGIAFPGGEGTSNMVDILEQRGIEVIVSMP